MDALRIAWEEAVRHFRRVDPKGAVVLLILGGLLGVLVAVVPNFAPAPEEDLFIVEAADSPFRAAVDDASRLRLLDGDGSLFATGDADIYLEGNRILYDRGDMKSRAAMEVFDQAVRRWLDLALLEEEDDAAAFPMDITLVYEAREARNPFEAPTEPEPEPEPTGGPSEGNGTADPAPTTEPPLAEQAEPVGEVRTGLRPDEVDPPFPIRSLLLTFAYLIPTSLLAQVHSANLHNERTRKRGVLLLSAPVRPGAILLGKSMPILAITILISIGITLALNAGLLAFLASLAFLGFLMATSSFLAILSRSPRELSLLQVASTTALNVFLFLPAMFPALPAVAFLSPIHVVAAGIRDEAVTLGPFLYATLPLSVSAAALGMLSVGFLREEILFSFRSGLVRIIQGIEGVTRKWWALLTAGVLVVPFVFAAELLVLVMAVVFGSDRAIFVLLPAIVALEELAKGLPVWARSTRRGMAPWKAGLLVGTGFFIAEKGGLLLTLVAFDSLPFSASALAVLGGGGILLLLLPLALHAGTAAIQGVGAARGRVGAFWGFIAACAIHLAYNAYVLREVFL